MPYERVGGGVRANPFRYRPPRQRPRPTGGTWKRANQGAATFQSASRPPPAPEPQNTAPTYGGSGPEGGGSSYFGDPAYEMAKAFGARTRKEAEARALEKRKTAALQFGSAEGLEKLLSKEDYASVSKAASENPFSVIKNLQRGYDKGVSDLEDQLNKANLFYSGYRGQQLKDAATQHQQARYTAGTQFQGLLSDVADQLSAALLQADMMEAQAAMAAAMGSFGGGDGSYEPPTEPPPPTTPPPPQTTWHPYIPPQLKRPPQTTYTLQKPPGLFTAYAY